MARIRAAPAGMRRILRRPRRASRGIFHSLAPARCALDGMREIPAGMVGIGGAGRGIAEGMWGEAGQMHHEAGIQSPNGA